MMKKRIVSMFMVALMAISFTSTSALAAAADTVAIDYENFQDEYGCSTREVSEEQVVDDNKEIANPMIWQDKNEDLEAFALDSFSGEQLGTVSSVSISQTGISFKYADTFFSFPLTELNIDTSDGKNISGAKFYSGKAGNLSCNVVEYNNSYCVQVLNKEESIAARKADNNDNFTIIIGEQVQNSIKEVSGSLNAQNKFIESNIAMSKGRGLHVYVSGLTIPFLISGGSAEGWCTATDRENNICQVYDLSYVVTYNWPSDGVSLWYDYMNNISAYSTPAWPSSELTEVDGTWSINKATGSFVAEASVSALVKGVPLMWTLYDVSFMDGTHQ